MENYLTNSEQETKKLAKNLAKKMPSGVVALSGELGAGKTTFVQGFAKGLGVTDKIISPTFVLIRQHKIPKTKKILYHIDLYRIEDTLNIDKLGIKELIDNPLNIVIIEWAEKIKSRLPKNTVKISFKIVGGDIRKITLSNPLTLF